MLTKREREMLMIGRGSYLARDDMETADRRVLHNLYCYRLVDLVKGETYVFETTERGEAELRRPAPPPKPGRVQCMNPVCAKTGAAEKFPNGMICGGCFKSTGDLRREVKALESRRRKVERLTLKHGRDSGALFAIDEQLHEIWRAIERFFEAPDRIEGLEAFIKEMGWDQDEDVSNEGLSPDDPERHDAMGPWTGGVHWDDPRDRNHEGDDDESREDEAGDDGEA